MKWRIHVTAVIFIALFFGLIFRLGYIMLLRHNHYQVLANRQHIKEQELVGTRGEIFTFDGYPLVVNTESFLLFAVPMEIEDKDDAVELLAETIVELAESIEILPDKKERVLEYMKKDAEEKEVAENEVEDERSSRITFPISLHTLRYRYVDVDDWKESISEDLEKVLSELLANDENQYVQLVNNLEISERDVIIEKSIDGMYFESNQKRAYPERTMAAHLLGIVGKDSEGEDVGYFGLEGYYNRELSGKSGYTLQERDVGGKPIPFGIYKANEAIEGRDLQLSIRREMQYILESKLKEGVERYDTKSATGVIVDPWTGKILAMATYPTFNPEYWVDELLGETDVSKVDVFRNASIAATYEPGSVIKPVTMSMALNEEVVEPDTIFHDTGPVVYSGYPVRTWNNQYSGDINMIQVLQLSNNTGAAWVGTQVGFDTFADYLASFGFGQYTGVDLQGEQYGIIQRRGDWRDITLANMSFGQGMSVTPIQLTSAMSAMVNGGVLYKPQIVEGFIESDGENIVVIPNPPEVLGNVLTEESSEQIRFMLKKVVEGGEFAFAVKQAGVDSFSLGGKTGTAQIPVDGTYDPHKTNVTFLGFGPVEKPEFVMLIRLEEPSTSTYSANTVVPIWMETAKHLMAYFNIPPEE